MKIYLNTVIVEHGVGLLLILYTRYRPYTYKIPRLYSHYGLPSHFHLSIDRGERSSGQFRETCSQHVGSPAVFGLLEQDYLHSS